MRERVRETKKPGTWEHNPKVSRCQGRSAERQPISQLKADLDALKDAKSICLGFAQEKELAANSDGEDDDELPGFDRRLIELHIILVHPGD